MVLACSFAFPPAVYALRGNTSADVTVGDWHSLILALGSRQVGRAMTGNGADFFMVDFPSAHCDTPFMQVMEVEQKYFAHKFQGGSKVRARVDAGPLEAGYAGLSEERGNNVVDVTMFFAHPSELLHEIKDGHTLRLQLFGLPSKPIYLHFSLNGSAVSIDRAHALCRRLGSDQRYFPSPNGNDHGNGVGGTTPE